MLIYLEKMCKLNLVCVAFSVLIILHSFGISANYSERHLNKTQRCLNCPEHCMCCNSTDLCFSCDKGYSGTVCQHFCDNCQTGTRCDKETGFCTEGCRYGLSGLYCNITCDGICESCHRHNTTTCLTYRNNPVSEPVCPYGLSGQYCNITCDGICESCHRHNTTKCLTYRNNPISEPVCPQDCLSQKCKRNNCTKRCLPGYWGKICEHICPEHCSIDSSRTDELFVVVPILTIALIILLGGILFMLCWKRRQSRRNNDSHLVVYRPQQMMERHMENHDHPVNMSWTYDDAFSDNYDHLAKSSSTTKAKSDIVVPEKNGNYSYAALDAGYKETHIAEDTKQNKRE